MISLHGTVCAADCGNERDAAAATTARARAVVPRTIAVRVIDAFYTFRELRVPPGANRRNRIDTEQLCRLRERAGMTPD